MKVKAGAIRIFLVISAVLLAGCVSPGKKELVEARWITEGESLQYEGNNWLPQRRFEVFAPKDLLKVAEYRGVPVYAEKVDIKPYRALYTKMGEYEYRLFTREKK